MTAFPLFLLGHCSLSWHAAAQVAAVVISLIGLVLAWVAALAYVGPLPVDP